MHSLAAQLRESLSISGGFLAALTIIHIGVHGGADEVEVDLSADIKAQSPAPVHSAACLQIDPGRAVAHVPFSMRGLF